MKKIITAVLMMVVCAAFYCTYAFAENEDFDSDTVIVITKPRPTMMSLMSTGGGYDFGDNNIADVKKIAELEASDISLFSLGNSKEEILCLTLAEGGKDKVLEAVDTLGRLDYVELAQPNYTYYLDATANDTRYSEQYSLRKVNAPSLWDIDIDCSDTVVAILDSGVQLGHVDLKTNLWTDVNGYHGYDFVNSDYEPEDNVGHGTHVAGIVSARTNNGKGIASLARNAKIAPLKVFDSQDGSTDMIIQSIQYILDYEKKYGKTFSVINCSFGAPNNDAALKKILQKCSDKVIVAAAGNTTTESAKNIDLTANIMYPACYDMDNIIAVANTTAADELSSTSCYGKTNVDIAAPGDTILSTVINTYSNSSYGYMSGTSMSTPLVSSAAAVLMSKCPDISPTDAKQYILDGADYVEALKEYVAGARRLNAYNSVVLALSPVTVTFNAGGGSYVPSQSINYRDTAVIPAEPSKNGYDFNGWLLDGTPYDFSEPVTQDITLTASWTIQSYTITWMYDSDTLLGETTATYGSVPEHDAPEKEADEMYSYKFTGWTPAVKPADKDITYTAVFEKTPIMYTITWKDDESSVISTTQAMYGTKLFPPAAPEKAVDEQYYYAFKEWVPAVADVTGDAEYTAVYSQVYKNYSADIPLYEQFSGTLTLTKYACTDGSIALAAASSEDTAQDTALYLYIAEYDGTDRLSGINKIPLSQATVIPDVREKNCRIFIWTDTNEPATDCITDMDSLFKVE